MKIHHFWDCEHSKEAKFSHELPLHAWNFSKRHAKRDARRLISALQSLVLCIFAGKQTRVTSSLMCADTQMTAFYLLLVLIVWVQSGIGWVWDQQLQLSLPPLHEVVLSEGQGVSCSGFFSMLLLTPNKMETNTEPSTTFMDLHLPDFTSLGYFRSHLKDANLYTNISQHTVWPDRSFRKTSKAYVS